MRDSEKVYSGIQTPQWEIFHKTHLLSFASAFRKFARFTGIAYLSASDLGILLAEAKYREICYQRPRKQA